MTPPLALGWVTRRHLLALAVLALLACLSFGAFESQSTRHERVLALTRATSDLGMLAQQAALYTDVLGEIPYRGDGAQGREALREATEALEEAHTLLDQVRPAVKALDLATIAGDIDQRLGLYIAALRTVLVAPDDPRSQADPMIDAARRVVVTEATGALSRDIAHLVERIQDEAVADHDRLRILHGGAFALTLITLLLEALLIFNPMVAQIRTQMRALEGARDDLEAKVRERTRRIDDAREAAVRATRSKSRFLAAVGHDLMQPLRAAAMLTGILDRGAGDPETMRRVIPDLKAAHQAMDRLVRAVIDLSRLDAGTVTPRYEEVVLHDLLERVVAAQARDANAKGLSLRLVRTSLRIRTDPVLLERIVSNLLSNAIRYTLHGGIVVGVRRHADGPALVVADTGVGIATRDRQRIFEEFTRLDHPAGTDDQGLGLGLAIVDRLSRLLGFDLALSSQLGRGTIFSVRLPARIAVPRSPGKTNAS
ncbi:sensor histidine kinase [Pararhodospirillum oryzae]|nr:HAMP domain-containing sensor histidine kinase [Pararhodospirillum oryzae]